MTTGRFFQGNQNLTFPLAFAKEFSMFYFQLRLIVVIETKCYILEELGGGGGGGDAFAGNFKCDMGLCI